MKKMIFCFSIIFFLFFLGSSQAKILFQDDFDESWSGDYAPGWENTSYRHGDAPEGQMMQQSDKSKSGDYGLKLIANSVQTDSQFWAGVNPTNLPHHAMDKKYDPYVSAWYYDEGGDKKSGQLFAVPDWVNLYLEDDSEDWTDVQFGARNTEADNYYYVAAGENSPGWENTDETRTTAWHHLKFQLSSSDGKIYFYLDGNEVGSSYRNDYTNLGTETGLFTMFDTPLSDWGDDKPYTIWDDVEVGSTVPEPTTWLLFGTGLLGLLAVGRKKIFNRGQA